MLKKLVIQVPFIITFRIQILTPLTPKISEKYIQNSYSSESLKNIQNRWYEKFWRNGNRNKTITI